MHLEGAAGAVRPGPIRHTFVKNGLLQGQARHGHARGDGDQRLAANLSPATLFQMHVAEGGPILASGHSKTTLLGFNAGLPGMSWLFGGEKFSDQPGLTYGHGKTTTSSTTTNLTETAGRLAQGTRTYLETNADMLWRITVTVQGKNIAHSGPVEYAGRIVKVRNGISFLRPGAARGRSPRSRAAAGRSRHHQGDGPPAVPASRRPRLRRPRGSGRAWSGTCARPTGRARPAWCPSCRSPPPR